MFAALAFLATTRIAPLPTFEEIQHGMYDAYRGLEHFQDQWEFTVQKGTDTPVKQDFDRRIDKNRMAFSAAVNGEPAFRQVHDGTTYGIMLVGSHQFATSITANQEHDAPYDKADHPKVDDNSFNYFVKGYDILFVSNPAFVVTTEEKDNPDGAKLPLRKVTAVMQRPDGGATLTLRYWFEPDKWILRRVELDGVSAAAGVFTVHGVATKVDYNAKSPATAFLINPSDVVGYKEVPLLDIKNEEP